MERLLQQQQPDLQRQWQQQQQRRPPSSAQLVVVLTDTVHKLWGTLIKEKTASNSSTAPSFLNSNSKEALNAAAAVASPAVVRHCAESEVGGTWTAPMFAAEQQLTALFKEVNTGRYIAAAAAAAAGSSASQQLQHWQQLLCSPKVLWLLALNQAVYAQYLQHQLQSHNSSSSSSSSGSSPPVVPAYHEQMFAALGVTAASAQERAANTPFLDTSGGSLDLAVLRTAVLSRAIWQQLMSVIHHSSSSSSSSRIDGSSNQQGTPPEQQQQLKTLVLTLLQPWLLLQLELLLLVNEGNCKQMLLQTIMTTYSVGMLLHSDMGTSEATIEAFRRSLQQPVLQLALPRMQEYVTEFARDAVTTAVAGGRAASSEQQQAMQAKVLEDLETHWATMLLETTAWLEGMCAAMQGVPTWFTI
jgi:hypothetical protein